MFTISVKDSLDKMVKTLTNIQQHQVPFATALALTKTAQDMQSSLTSGLDVFDRPTSFTKRAFAVKRAEKRLLTAKVYARPIQAAYLRWQVEGGTRYPKRKGIPIPKGIGLNSYGNMPNKAIQKLLARPDVFSGTVKGIGGIWKRLPDRDGGGSRVELLVAWEGQAKYRKLFMFYDIAYATAKRKFPGNLAESVVKALKTARK